ncbi:Hypothetical protein A7982_10677 [Minicystis rosea]|nr:Hypothetical protein A7982_10677 [Minicystis rosea]
MSAVAILSVTAAGCGAGLSKEDADVRCDQDKSALGFDDKVYANCEECRMTCGDDCVLKATTPISYACPDDSASTTSSSSSSGQ